MEIKREKYICMRKGGKRRHQEEKRGNIIT
jgi:hypothetical protein